LAAGLRDRRPREPPQDLVRDVSDRSVVRDTQIAEVGADAVRKPPDGVAHVPHAPDGDRARQFAFDLLQRQGQPHDTHGNQTKARRFIKFGVDRTAPASTRRCTPASA
jgi:hypothetical protein